MNRYHIIVSCLAGAVLIAGVGLVLIGTRPPAARTSLGSVKDLLPDPELVARAGWKGGVPAEHGVICRGKTRWLKEGRVARAILETEERWVANGAIMVKI